MPDFGVADLFLCTWKPKSNAKHGIIMWNNSPPVHLLHHKGNISDTHAGGIKQRAFIWDMVCYLDTCIFIPVDTAYADRSFLICIFAYIVCNIVKNPSEKVWVHSDFKILPYELFYIKWKAVFTEDKSHLRKIVTYCTFHIAWSVKLKSFFIAGKWIVKKLVGKAKS